MYREFWLKTHTYREQPSITFQHKVLGTLQGTKNNSIDRQMQIVFSSMTDVENLYGPELKVCNLQNIELDFNPALRTSSISRRFVLCPWVKLFSGLRWRPFSERSYRRGPE